MSLASRSLPSAPREPTDSDLIDCDIHNYLPADDALRSYLSARAWSRLARYGYRTHQPLPFPGAPYPRSSGGGKREDATPPSGLPVGADYEFTREQHLDALPLRYGILNCLSKVGEQLDERFDAELAHAMNAWQADAWLAADDRLRASLLVAYEDGESAAREIEHWAGDRRYVQVLVAPRTREPLGRRKYWPMYAAAEAAGLPVGIHFGAISANPITAGGWASYYLEDHTDMCAAFQAHVTSLVFEGVFERFPALRVVLIEGGFAWMPALMWRMDFYWRRLRDEVPHVVRPPSEYVREAVRITTQPIEEPHRAKEHLPQVLEQLGTDRMLMFASDYPHWDYDDPGRAFPIRLPEALKRRIMLENAADLYRLGAEG